MASFDDVRLIVDGLPETTERVSRDHLFWRVRGKGFVWERPLRATDIEELGEDAPEGPVLGARLPDLSAKAALLADPSGVYFTTSHFDGHPAILVRLADIPADELRELIVEAWLVRAPARVARGYAEAHLGAGRPHA